MSPLFFFISEDFLCNHYSSQLDDILNAQEEFDFLLFFSELNQIMKSHLSFYQIIAQKNAYAYLIKDFSRILEKDWANTTWKTILALKTVLKSGIW